MTLIHDLYFNRISYHDPIDTTLETLKKLTYAHVTSIPFENLDIFYQIPASLDQDAIFNKIVKSNRGGYCYELNILFHDLLKELGFNVKLAIARLANKNNEINYDSVHSVILVKHESLWLIDVSWGKGAIHPIDLLQKTTQDQFFSSYQSIRVDEGFELWQKIGNSGWQKMYIIMPDLVALDWINLRHEYHQTNPQSEFRKKPVVIRPHKSGYNLLRGNNVISYENGIYKCHTIPDYQLSSYIKKLGLESFAIPDHTVRNEEEKQCKKN